MTRKLWTSSWRSQSYCSWICFKLLFNLQLFITPFLNRLYNILTNATVIVLRTGIIVYDHSVSKASWRSILPVFPTYSECTKYVSSKSDKCHWYWRQREEFEYSNDNIEIVLIQTIARKQNKLLGEINNAKSTITCWLCLNAFQTCRYLYLGFSYYLCIYDQTFMKYLLS